MKTAERPSPPRNRRVRHLLVTVALAVSLTGACTGERPTLGPAPSTTETTPGTPTTGVGDAAVGPKAGSVAELVPGPDTMLGYIATPAGEPVVHAEPDEASLPVGIPATTANGAPTTFAVIGTPEASPAGWLRVLLPTRPNGTTAWVPAESVALTQTPMQVHVDLAAATLRVTSGSEELFETTVAIGTEQDPTPTGVSYVTELLDNIEPDGAYGPYAFGLALHSETRTEFAGGPGQVGIHGTNQPSLIGQRVSHGCVRLTNDDIEQMVDLALPLGVPVFIA